MKKAFKNFLIISIIAVVLVGVALIIQSMGDSVESLSTIRENTIAQAEDATMEYSNSKEFPELSCQTDDDCMQYFIDAGVGEEMQDEVVKCNNQNYCVVNP